MSVNAAWQGKRYKTNEYKSYERSLLYILPQLEIPKPPLKIYFEFGISKTTDYDNPIKPLQDILQKRYGFDDKDIEEAHIRKKVVKKGNEYFKINIGGYEKSPENLVNINYNRTLSCKCGSASWSLLQGGNIECNKCASLLLKSCWVMTDI